MTEDAVKSLNVGLDTLVKFVMVCLLPLMAWAMTSIVDLKDSLAELRSDVRVVVVQVKTIERLDGRITGEAARITTLGQRYNDLATRLSIIESQSGSLPR